MYHKYIKFTKQAIFFYPPEHHFSLIVFTLYNVNLCCSGIYVMVFMFWTCEELLYMVTVVLFVDNQYYN
jgi:hypothetical protein